MDTEQTAKDMVFPFPFASLKKTLCKKMSSAFGAGKEQDPRFSCGTSANSWLLWMGAGEGFGDA